MTEISCCTNNFFENVKLQLKSLSRNYQVKVLFGPPGSGKTSLSQLLVHLKPSNLFHMGNTIQRLSQEKSPLGAKIKKTLQANNLIDTNTAVTIFEDFLNTNNPFTDMIIDGFPQSIDQLNYFANWIKHHHFSCAFVILDVADDVLLSRISLRSVCRDCEITYNKTVINCPQCRQPLTTRQDDDIHTAKRRLTRYHHQVKPLIHQIPSFIDKYLLTQENKLALI